MALLCCVHTELIQINPRTSKWSVKKRVWFQAMQDEIHEFDRLEVWELVPRLIYVMVIALKWIYKVKLDEYGDVLKNKARLVAKGYRQEEGIDFEESFAQLHYRGHQKIHCQYSNQEHIIYQMECQTAFRWQPRAWNDTLIKVFPVGHNFLQGTVDPTEELQIFKMSDDGTNVVILRTQFLKVPKAILLTKRNISRNLKEIWEWISLTLSDTQCLCKMRIHAWMSRNSRKVWSSIGEGSVFGDRLVSWSSRSKRSTAISTTEAEYSPNDAEQNVPAQPPTRTDEQIVPRSQWLTIGKSNLLFNAQKIQKNPIFQISFQVDEQWFRSKVLRSTQKGSSNYSFNPTHPFGIPPSGTRKTSGSDKPRPPKFLQCCGNPSHKASLKNPKKKVTPLLIPYGRFSMVIIYYLASNNNIHRRPDYAVHHTGDDFILGNLKFVLKGETVEVFGMAIPNPLITEAIQQSSYYPLNIVEMFAMNTKKTPQESASEQPATRRTPPKKPTTTTPVKPSKSTLAPTKKPSKHKLPQKVRKGKPTFQLVDEDDEAQQESVPQDEGDDPDLELAKKMSLEAHQEKGEGEGQAPVGGVTIRDPVSETTPKLPEVVGKGKAIVTEEQVAHSLIDLSKKKRTTDQFILVRHDQTPHDSTTGPSSQPEDDTLEKVIHESSLTSDSERTESETEVAAPKGDKDQGEVDSSTVTSGVSIPISDPKKAYEALAGPDPEPMQEDQTGSNSRKLHVSLAGPNPEHMDDEFLATAYLKVHENLKLITDERVIDDNPERTKLDDALFKVLERHTAYLIKKYSVLPGPESIQNQESKKSPKEIIITKREQGEEKQDSTYSISTYGSFDSHEDAMGLEGKSAKRRRHDSGASGSAQPPTKDDEQSSKKPRESDASTSKQHPALTFNSGMAITYTRDALLMKGTSQIWRTPITLTFPRCRPLRGLSQFQKARDLLHLNQNGPFPRMISRKPENNWANTYATTYKVPAENKLQRKTYDIGSFMKWFYRRTGKKKLYKADLEGDKERKISLSISKLKAARYLDFELEELVPSLWVESEREYDISAVYGITHWWFTKKGISTSTNTVSPLLVMRPSRRWRILHVNQLSSQHVDKKPGDQNRVGDLQVGLKVYQTKINLERPNWDAADYYFKEDYTIVPKPRAVVYRDRNDQRKLMRLNELHKFSDGTLTRVMEKLDQMVKDFHPYEYNKGHETNEEGTQGGGGGWGKG
ncbi:retrovirus-related pol polyprotein from transposon TNT 1-94 [Tanacetum coccineum]